jgi:hypothetical protein
VTDDKFVSRPYFENNETKVEVQQGEVAFFNCHVRNLANQTVGSLGLTNQTVGYLLD